MDTTCGVCGHTTDNGEGFCNFCRTPHPQEEVQPEETEEQDDQLGSD